MKRHVLNISILLFAFINTFGQPKSFNLYLYDYADYPEVEKSGDIKKVDNLVFSQENKHLDHALLENNNRVGNTFYYDIRNSIKKTITVRNNSKIV